MLPDVDSEVSFLMYTLEVYKPDARTKKGERLVFKTDYDTSNISMLKHTVAQTWPSSKFRCVIHATYVTRVNLMSGQEFQERYDTPWGCSPASESYWSS